MTSKVLKYLILLAFVLLIVAISSLWVSKPAFREGDVILKIEGPTQVASGDEVTYKLKYENQTRSDLVDLDLVFYYPEGSTLFIDGKVSQDHVEDFKIPELASGEKGEKEFSAFLIGERGNIKVAKAVLSFKAGNLTSSFEKTVSLSTTIVTTPISLTLVAPPTSDPGGIINYILDYRNESEEDASDLILEFDYPEGFMPKDMTPLPKEGNNIWLVKSLKKGTGGRISLNGKLSGKEGENKVVTAVLKRKVGDEYVDYQKVSAATVISNPALSVQVLVNETADYSAFLGDRLDYTVKYSNNSNVAFSGMNLIVKLEGDMYDLSFLDTKGGLFDDSNKTITWNSSAIPEFANFFPNTKGQVSFRTSLKYSFPLGTASDKFVKLTATLSTPNVPTGFDGEEVAVSSSLITKIGTQPTFNRLAYYNDPDFGSSGPWPMKAGEETMITIHWQLANPGNDVENIKVSGRLPTGVAWADMVKSTPGQLLPVYHPNMGEVSWTVSRLPYGTGVSLEKYEASFRVKIKPSSIQKGRIIPLLDNIHFTGTDNFTKQNINITRGSLDSNQLTDRPREGTVQ